MEFADEELDVTVAGRHRRLRVTGDALHCLWGADIGPQDGAGLVAANASFLTDLAVLKLAEGAPSAEIIITAMDIEG